MMKKENASLKNGQETKFLRHPTSCLKKTICILLTDFIHTTLSSEQPKHDILQNISMLSLASFLWVKPMLEI